MVLQQAITYLTRRAHETPLTVSEPLIVGVPFESAVSDSRGADVYVRDPNGEQFIVKAALSPAGQMAATVPHADLPGAYEIRFTKDAASALKMAVNVDPAESDVRGLRAEALTNALAGVECVRVLGEEQDLLASIRESRFGRELWRILLFCAVAALVAEAILARWFARRMAGKEAQEGILGSRFPGLARENVLGG